MIQALAKALQRALYHDADNAEVLYRLGQVYLLQNDRNLAETYFEMAMEHASEDLELESAIRNALRDLEEADEE